MDADEKHLAVWNDITNVIAKHEAEVPAIDMIVILSRILGVVACTLPQDFDTTSLEGMILTQVAKGNQIAFDLAAPLATMPSQGRA